MIKSFQDKHTEALYQGETVRRFAKVAVRKLDMIAAAKVLDDLRSPPGNRLEALQGNRAGQYSIRINDQVTAQVPPVFPDDCRTGVAPPSGTFARRSHRRALKVRLPEGPPA